MKVLLVNSNRLKVPYPVFPLGLDYVAGSLGPHAAKILDLCPEAEGAEAELIARAVQEWAPDAVGISIRNIDNTDSAHLKAFLDDMRAVVRAVRAATRAPVVLGGAGYTLFAGELLETLEADYGIVGEGERMRGLLDALEAGKGSLAGPAPEGVAVRGQAAPKPIPWRETIERCPPDQNPQLPWYLKHGSMLNVQTQRGCPFRCVYCTYPSIEGRALRPIDLDQVCRTAMKLQDAGAQYLFLTDSSFNAKAEHALEVARALKQAGLKIAWGAYFTPVKPPDGFYAELAACGCSHIEFGTDVLADSMLQANQKPFTFEHVSLAHRQARAAGLNVAHFMLLGGPGETAQTVDETLARAETLTEAAFFFFCGMRIYPGTDLWKRAVAEGQLAADAPLLLPVFYRPPIPLEEIVKRVEARAQGRQHWIVGAGGDQFTKLLWRMYERGYTGPLWERLI